MKHSTKRRMLRLSISPTSPHREVANRLSTARLSPGFPGGLLKRLRLFYTLRCVLSIHTTISAQISGEDVFAEDLCIFINSRRKIIRIAAALFASAKMQTSVTGSQ